MVRRRFQIAFAGRIWRIAARGSSSCLRVEGLVNGLRNWWSVAAISALALGCSHTGKDVSAGSKPATHLKLPIEYHTLDNGLRVVLSHDPSAAIATVAVYYNIGMRLEPQNRTGFAHLFEHMMFQGSQ